MRFSFCNLRCFFRLPPSLQHLYEYVTPYALVGGFKTVLLSGKRSQEVIKFKLPSVKHSHFLYLYSFSWHASPPSITFNSFQPTFGLPALSPLQVFSAKSCDQPELVKRLLSEIFKGISPSPPVFIFFLPWSTDSYGSLETEKCSSTRLSYEKLSWKAPLVKLRSQF